MENGAFSGKELAMFFVGQKVVCINDTENDFCNPNMLYRENEPWLLRKGEVYTIIELTVHKYGSACMRLAEIPSRGKNDSGYNRNRFRPLVEKKTDISLFKSMLNGSLKEKKARLNGIKEKEHA